MHVISEFYTNNSLHRFPIKRISISFTCTMQKSLANVRINTVCLEEMTKTKSDIFLEGISWLYRGYQVFQHTTVVTVFFRFLSVYLFSWTDFRFDDAQRRKREKGPTETTDVAWAVRERSLIIGGGGPVKFHKGGPKNINPPSN